MKRLNYEVACRMTRMSTIPQTLSRAMTTQDSVALGYTRLLLLLALFGIGLGIRLVHANEPPLNFHATRQYRSLLIARAHYVELAPSLPEWEQQVARISRERQGTLEPPIMEWLVAAGYSVAGGERFWLPRVLASLCWLVGGGFLYLIARRLAGVSAALLATLFYLFLPFAAVASTSFQPDPLMVMLLLVAVTTIIRYDDMPTNSRLLGAAMISALAFLVKPVSLFPLLGVFVTLALWRHGFWRSIRYPKLYLFLLISLLPVTTFYVYGIFIAGFLRTQAQSSFLPQLWLISFLWRGWLGNVDTVVGFATFIVALLGLFLFRDGFARAVMIGLWGGYAAFCLVFNYHVATHDYYHLMLVPIVALSIGPVAALIVERILAMHSAWYARAALSLLALLLIVFSVAKAEARLRVPGGEQTMRIAVEIGEHVNHSTNTVYLSADYGLPLEYHGKLSGVPWPLISDLEWERLAGLPVLPAEERFAAWFAPQAPDYFIVGDMREFEAQADLKHFLFTNFSVVARTPHYLIFDLRDRNTEHEEGRKRLTERTERKTLFSL